jgi:sulfonate transport system permease protein
MTVGAVQPKTRSRAFFNNPWVQQLLPWVAPILLIIIWQTLAQIGWISTRVLPAPLDVIKAAFRLAGTGELLTNIWVSSRRAISGFLIGGSLAFFFGLMNGVFRIAELLLDTSLQMLRNIPNLAMIPLVILWFGIGEEGKLFLVSLSVFFPIYINTFYGIRNIDPGLIEMGKVYGLNTKELFQKIIIPGALPSILVGIRYSLGIMWLTLIVVETIATDAGIGYMAMNAREFLQTDVIVLAIVLYALLGKLADSLARLLEKTWLKWNPAYQ